MTKELDNAEAKLEQSIARLEKSVADLIEASSLLHKPKVVSIPWFIFIDLRKDYRINEWLVTKHFFDCETSSVLLGKFYTSENAQLFADAYRLKEACSQ